MDHSTKIMLTLAKLQGLFAPQKGVSEFLQFRKFYDDENNRSLIENWLAESNPPGIVSKNDAKSERYRMNGNEQYNKRNFTAALELFNESVLHADPNTEMFGKAVGNRSAVFYHMNMLQECIEDCRLCLQSSCVDIVVQKIYLRLADCAFRLGNFQEFADVSNIIRSFKNPIYEERLKLITKYPRKKYGKIKVDLPISDNTQFLGATRKVKLNYNEKSGRHVIAREDIQPGELLFVEKAYIQAPVFGFDGKLDASNCYKCAVLCINFYPCMHCTVAKFCSRKCFDDCWSSEHQFECRAMAIWASLGIALPAFKLLLKGVKSGFAAGVDPELCVLSFGDCRDNYAYVNSLMSHVEETSNITPLLVIASIVVTYLKQINFYDWLKAQPNVTTPSDAQTFIGSVLLRHMLQLGCNASAIAHYQSKAPFRNDYHYVTDETDHLDCSEEKIVAVGIYPAISMMNHSCKANIALYYINDTAIVKAIEEIKAGDVIYNCYGIDWAHLDKEERQQELYANYKFWCTCSICSYKKKEFNYVNNYYLCSNCHSRADTVNPSTVKCVNCAKQYPKLKFNKATDILTGVIDSTKSAKEMREIQPIITRYFSSRHWIIHDFYEKLYDILVETGFASQASPARSFLLKSVAETWGCWSKKRAFALKKYAVETKDVACLIEQIMCTHFPIKEFRVVGKDGEENNVYNVTESSLEGAVNVTFDCKGGALNVISDGEKCNLNIISDGKLRKADENRLRAEKIDDILKYLIADFNTMKLDVDDEASKKLGVNAKLRNSLALAEKLLLMDFDC